MKISELLDLDQYFGEGGLSIAFAEHDLIGISHPDMLEQEEYTGVDFYDYAERLSEECKKELGITLWWSKEYNNWCIFV